MSIYENLLALKRFEMAMTEPEVQEADEDLVSEPPSRKDEEIHETNPDEDARGFED